MVARCHGFSRSVYLLIRIENLDDCVEYTDQFRRSFTHDLLFRPTPSSPAIR